MRSIQSGFLSILLLFLLVLLDCTPLFPLFSSSPLLFDYLPSAYLFSTQLWNILGIIIFSFVITLVSRSNSLWSPSTAWPLCNGTVDWTYGLLLKTATPDEATPSSVQRSEAYSGSRRPNHRTENGRSPTAHSHQRRSRVGGRRDTRQSLALEKIPVSHQVERVWLQTQLLGICLQSFHTRTDGGILLQTPGSSKTHPAHGVRQHLWFGIHCSEA